MENSQPGWYLAIKWYYRHKNFSGNLSKVDLI